MDVRQPSLSLVLPAYNEQESIAQAILEADAALNACTSDYEILVVDDGSKDQTSEIVSQIAAGNPRVRLLKQEGNQGYGAALARGFREAKMDLVSFTDSDCQFDLTELQHHIALARKHDVVCGYRIDRQDPWIRKVYSGVYNMIVRTLLGTGVRDVDCALKVFRREVIQNIDIETSGFFVNSEVITKARIAGHSVVEVGVTHRPRHAGESTVSPLHIPPVFASIFRYWWNVILFPRVHAADKSYSPRWPRRTEFIAAGLLLVASAVVLLPSLSYPLIEPDETRYVQISLEMLESGNWITPTLDGKAYLDKPPLLYWMTATSLSIFGHNEFAARLPSVFSAILTVLMVFAFGTRLVGSRAAFIGSVALLLCGGFVMAGRFLVMDPLLTACTTACFLTSYLAVSRPRVHWGWWMIAGLACALGILAKGPVAAVLCLPPLFIYASLSRSKNSTRVAPIGWVHWVALATPIVALCLPWYLAISTTNGEFSAYFFWNQNVVRFTSGLNHAQPMWFYIPVILLGMFPASMLLPLVGAFLLGRSEAKRSVRTIEMGFLALGAVWVVGFFSIASCKLPTYILPALPLGCLLIGAMLHHTVFNPRRSSKIAEFLKPFPLRATWTAIGVGAVAAIADIVVDHNTMGISLLTLFICIALAIYIVRYRDSIRFLSAQSNFAAWSCVAVLGLLLISFTFGEFISSVANVRSVHHRAAQLSLATHKPVVYFDHNAFAATFYLPKEEIVHFERSQQAEFVDYVASHPGAVVVTSRGQIELTRNAIQNTATLVESGGRKYVYVSTPIAAKPPLIATKSTEIPANDHMRRR